MDKRGWKKIPAKRRQDDHDWLKPVVAIPQDQSLRNLEKKSQRTGNCYWAKASNVFDKKQLLCTVAKS